MIRWAGLATACLLLSAVAGAGGCGGDDSGEGGEVIVSAAASLEPAFTAYAERAGFDAKQSFAGSDELAAQIREGVKPDVYAAANTALPDQLHAEGLVAQPVVFASNRLVVAVPAGSGAVRSIDDLRSEGVTLAIGDEGAPVGDYTREVLARLPDGAAILANVRSQEPDVSGIVGKLTQGAVDAGFVYATDVTAIGGQLDAIELPSVVQPEVAYGATVVEDADHPQQARDFIHGLLSGPGEEALREAGFGPPPAG